MARTLNWIGKPMSKSNSMAKLFSLLGLFRQGAVVADPKKWKERQITATVLAGLLLAIVNVLGAFGYVLPIDTETANAIAAGIIAVVNVILSITTTDKVGLPANSDNSESANPDAQVQPQLSAKPESKHGAITAVPKQESATDAKAVEERDSKQQYLA